MKISSIIKEKNLINSKTYNSLSPVMKEAVCDMFTQIEKETGDIIKKFDSAVEKVAEHYNINKKELYQYIEKETNEQLGVK